MRPLVQLRWGGFPPSFTLSLYVHRLGGARENGNEESLASAAWKTAKRTAERDARLKPGFCKKNLGLAMGQICYLTMFQHTMVKQKWPAVSRNSAKQKKKSFFRKRINKGELIKAGNLYGQSSKNKAYVNVLKLYSECGKCPPAVILYKPSTHLCPPPPCSPTV